MKMDFYLKKNIIIEINKKCQLNIIDPPAPGTFLRSLLIESKHFKSIAKFSKYLNMCPQKMGAILSNKQKLNKDLCIRLGNYLDIEPKKIMMLQINYDLYSLTEKKKGQSLL